MPAEFTTEASQILANTVAFAEPDGSEAPFLRVSGLSAPTQADTGATVDVNATVTSLGNQTDTQTVEFVLNGSAATTVTDVELDPGAGRPGSVVDGHGREQRRSACDGHRRRATSGVCCGRLF